jgi:hypothetical protein
MLSTSLDVESRIDQVVEWMRDSGGTLSFRDGIDRIREAFGLRRRRAIHYWVEARTRLMSPKQRYLRAQRSATVRDRHGRFASRPIVAE